MKLFQKFWVSIVCVTTAVLLLVFLVYAYLLYNTQMDNQYGVLEQQSATISNMIDSGTPWKNFVESTERLCNLQGTSVVLFDRARPENSFIVYTSAAVQSEVEARPELYELQAASGTPLTLRVRSQLGKNTHLLLYGRNMPDGRYLLVISRTATLMNVIFGQSRTLVMLILLSIIPTTLLSYLLAGAILRPIQDIDAASRQIATGNFDVHIEAGGSDELASLASSINAMSAQLKKSDSFKNEIISNVSHNLKTPIAAILTYAELLADNDDLPREQRQAFVGIIAARARTLEEMVKSLILLSKIQTGSEPVQLDLVDLEALCRQVADAHAGIAGRRGVSIETRAQEGLRRVCSDREKLATVVGNLLSNAVAHCDPGGQVEISLRPAGGGVAVSVADDGEGIHPDDLPLIWERFYKSPHSRAGKDSGSGLGMHIVKSIFELLGCPYGIESTLGEGTCVSFTVPDGGEAACREAEG
ncbi:MAG: HAMP domain-containing histidine kinase [Clostridiales bacterium]|nr:HAMP domain-containing histidine kinase [Clostridiales bacterium]